MIVIIGASGAVGVPTIRHLVGRAAPVRALTSNAASAARLRDLGVGETVVGDFRDDGDVARVLDGARKVFLVTPRFTEDEAEIGIRVVDAAKAAAVDHFVFSSAYHPQMRKMAHHWTKLRIEEAVIESGLSFTILNPSMFMQNVRVEWRSVAEDGVYPRPYSPHRSMSLVDTEDLGEAAAIVLTEDGYAGASFELCGPDSLSHAEMAGIWSEVLGREVRAIERDLEEWKEWARDRGWAGWSIDAYTAMCAHYDAHGYPGGNPLVLRTLLGREPTGYREFAERLSREMNAT
jgi:uncharacterized protein YbjT (DUF2867 family)